MSSRKSCCSGFYTIYARGCFAHRCKGSLHPRAVPAEGNVSPHLHLSEHKVFAAPMSRDGFEHHTTYQMEEGRCSLGCLLLPRGNKFWQRVYASGSMSTAVTLVWTAAETRSVTSCLHPVPFPSCVCFCTATPPAKLGLAENSFPALAGQDPSVAPHAAPQHWGNQAQWQPTATFNCTFNTQDSQRPWGWGQLTWLPAVSQLLLRGCSSFAILQNGISTLPET